MNNTERNCDTCNDSYYMTEKNPSALQQHIFAQLKYELLNCKSAYRLCGLTDAPKEYRKSDMVSLDHIPESSSLYEQVMAA